MKNIFFKKFVWLRLILIIFALGLLSNFASQALAQGAGTGIQGYTKDANGQYLSGVKVYQNNQLVAASSDNGYFQAIGLTAGSYTFTSAKDGYSAINSIKATVMANQIIWLADLNMRLNPRVATAGSTPDTLKEVGVMENGVFKPKSTFTTADNIVVKITVEGNKVESRQYPDIMMVMDVSGSMAWSFSSADPTAKIEAAKRSLKYLVNDPLLDPPLSDPTIDKIGLAVYNSGATLSQDLTIDFNAVKTAITGMSAGGTTSIGAGMGRGLWGSGLQNITTGNGGLLGPNHRDASPRYMILATDGQQNTSPSVYTNVWNGKSTLDIAVENNIVVYTVGIGVDVFGSGDMICPDCPAGINTGDKYMKDIAQKTGGKFVYAANNDELIARYKEIKEEINYLSKVWIEDWLTPEFSDPSASIIKVTDGYGNQVTNNLTIVQDPVSKQTKITGLVGQYRGSGERIIYLQTKAKDVGSNFSVDDSNKPHKITYTNPLCADYINHPEIGCTVDATSDIEGPLVTIVFPAPIIQLSVTPNRFSIGPGQPGQTVTLTWCAKYADYVEISPHPPAAAGQRQCPGPVCSSPRPPECAADMKCCGRETTASSVDKTTIFRATAYRKGTAIEPGGSQTTAEATVVVDLDMGVTSFNLKGLFVGNDFEVLRKRGTINYDSRILINPPPGFSLFLSPTWKEAAP